VVGFILPDLRNIIVAYHGGNYLTLVGVEERLLLEPECRWSESLLFAPEAKLFCGYAAGHLIQWDVNNGGLVRRFEGHTGRVESMALLPEGQFVSASADSTMIIWDIATGNKIRTLVRDGCMAGVTSVAVLTDGSLVSGATNGTIRVWNIATGECTKSFRDRAFVTCVAVLGDGRVVSGGGRDLHVWNIHTGQKSELRSPATLSYMDRRPPAIVCVLALTDGRVVTSSGYPDGFAHVWDVTTGQCTTIPTGHHNKVKTMAELPDGRVVSGALFEDTLRVWDPSSGVNSTTLVGHDRHMVRSVIVLPDGRAVSGSDADVRVWR
jgi:WD40 repeat protein